MSHNDDDFSPMDMIGAVCVMFLILHALAIVIGIVGLIYLFTTGKL